MKAMGRWWMRGQCFEMIRLVTDCLLRSSRITLLLDPPYLEITELKSRVEAAKQRLVDLRDTLMIVESSQRMLEGNREDRAA